jgi:hypothetical protein
LQQIPLISTGSLGNILNTYCPNKLENHEEMEKFLDMWPTKLNQEDIKNLNTSIMKQSDETMKSPSTRWIHCSILHLWRITETNVPQTIPQNRNLRIISKSILQSQYYPDTKTGQETKKKKKENYRPISLMNIYAKISVTFLQNKFDTTLKNHISSLTWFHSRNARIVSQMPTINISEYKQNQRENEIII